MKTLIPKPKKDYHGFSYEWWKYWVQFEISRISEVAKTVKPAVVMADGESANPGEFVMFTTNGQSWQHIGEWKKSTKPTTSVTFTPQDTDNLSGQHL